MHFIVLAIAYFASIESDEGLLFPIHDALFLSQLAPITAENSRSLRRSALSLLSCARGLPPGLEDGLVVVVKGRTGPRTTRLYPGEGTAPAASRASAAVHRPQMQCIDQ